ncbi:MAG TPA: fumarylacetoacetate hydrolase family protein [Aliidongia sp.]|nr:fumarylacetoacetate hydrolase family protein [Aliidongia sp.]
MTFAAADAAAAWMTDLWRSGRQATALPAELRPATIAEGYDIQDRFVAGLGQEVAGWKLGVGNPRQRAETGAGGSIAGRIFAARCHRPGDVVALPDRAPVTIEFEIAYVLGRDIRPEDPVTDPMAAIGETRVTFELVRSRFVDRRAVGWPSFAADNAAFEALVIGAPVDGAELDALAASAVVLVDGEERARSLTGEDATDPVQAFVDFVALARQRGMTLPKGAIVSTGTVTKPFNIEGAVTIEARYLDQRVGFRTSVRHD